jgi:aldehyde:ferredoxin oxidoreductase
MECYEKGLINKRDTDGIDLTWGSSEAILNLTKKIAFKEGFGAILAEGVKRASERIGKGSERFAIHVKGLSPPTIDPRAQKVYNSRYITASRGGDHLRGQGPTGHELDALPLTEGVKRLIFYEDMCALTDLMGVCKLAYGLYSSSSEIVKLKAKGIADMYSAAMGINVDLSYLLESARRGITLERLFNVREGIIRKDDTLPERFLKEPLPEGPNKGKTYDILDEFLNEYYTQRGWNLKTGIPETSTH